MEDSFKTPLWLPPDILTSDDLEELIPTSLLEDKASELEIGQGSVSNDLELVGDCDLSSFVYGSVRSPQESQWGHQAVCGDPGTLPHDLGLECDLQDDLVSEVERWCHANFSDLPIGPVEEDLSQHLNNPTVIEGLQDVSEGCQASYLTLGVDQSASSAKTGSRAFCYVSDDALLETHGIPAPSRLALMTDYSATSSFKTQTMDAKLVPDSASSIIPCDTVPIHAKLVSDSASSIFIPFGTVPTDPELVPNKATSVPILCGTQTVEPKLLVPNTATNVSICHSESYGTVFIDGELMVPGTSTTFPDQGGTIPMDTILNINKINAKVIEMSEKSNDFSTYNDAKSNIPGTYNDAKSNIPGTYNDAESNIPGTYNDTKTHIPSTHTELGTSRKRRRRRRGAEGDDTEARKTRKYDQGPLSDLQEERKRKDAIRAKNCRDKNRKELMERKEKLQEVEKEKESLAKEITQRIAYEEVIRKLLLEKTGIIVLPFHTASDKMAPPQL